MNVIETKVEERIGTKENLIFINSNAFVSSYVLCTHVLEKAIFGKQRWFFLHRTHLSMHIYPHAIGAKVMYLKSTEHWPNPACMWRELVKCLDENLYSKKKK